MDTIKQMVEEIRNNLANGEGLDEIKDRSGEIVDGYLPLYNNEIIKEWQEMPSDYDDRGWAELGDGGDTTIINRMTLDIYLYYSDLFNEAIQEVEEALEGAE